jgi:hypothetical protein
LKRYGQKWMRRRRTTYAESFGLDEMSKQRRRDV